MTINSVTTRGDATYGAGAPPGQRTPKPPPRIWNAKDPPFKSVDPSVSDGYQQSSDTTVIVIDNGQIVSVTLSHMCNIANLYILYRRQSHSSRVVVRQNSAPLFPPQRSTLQRPEAQSHMFLRRLRCICGCHNPWAAEERFRAWKQHCRQLGCHGRGAGLRFREVRGRWG